MNGDRIFQCEPCLHYMERDREAILRKNHVVRLMSFKPYFCDPIYFVLTATFSSRETANILRNVKVCGSQRQIVAFGAEEASVSPSGENATHET